jgi:hypothetical protein
VRNESEKRVAVGGERYDAVTLEVMRCQAYLAIQLVSFSSDM